MQANIPAVEKAEPRVIRFYVPRRTLPKKRHVTAWTKSMTGHLAACKSIPGDPVVKHINTYPRSGKPEYQVVQDPQGLGTEGILGLRTYAEAK